MGITVSLSCPSCGGPVRVADASRTTSCPYCDSLLYVEESDGVRSIVYKNVMDRHAVLRTVAEWFNEGLKARDLDKVGKVREVYPVYVPFWKLNARAAGWICGYVVHRRRTSKGHYTEYKEHKERMILQDYTWTNIACDSGDIGIESLRNLSGEVISKQDDVPTFEVTTSRTDAQHQGEEAIREMARETVRLTRVTFEKIHVIPNSFLLVYYPIWMVRYNYRERSYFVTVDGVTGKTLSGRAPGDPLFQGLVATGGSAIGGLLASLGLYFGLLLESEVSYIAVVGGVGLAYLSYRFFRLGSEIVQGDIESPYKKRKRRRRTSHALSGPAGDLMETFFDNW
ncbi:MAG: hypothetical protein ACE5QF_09650 [Thermoplasmata archaeon]